MVVGTLECPDKLILIFMISGKILILCLDIMSNSFEDPYLGFSLTICIQMIILY